MPNGPRPRQKRLRALLAAIVFIMLTAFLTAISPAAEEKQPVVAPTANVKNSPSSPAFPEKAPAGVARPSVPETAVSAGPAASTATAASKKFATPRNDIGGLKNFAKVSDVLYRGEQPTAEGFAALKKMGIKTVISLRAFHSDRAMLAGLGMYYKRMGIYTWDFRDEYVVNFLKLVTNPQYQPVFVHCQHGADRTGTMCAIYRAAAQGWSMSDAMSEMHNFGFHTIWSNLKKYLESIDPKKVMAEVDKAATVEAELVK